MALEKADFRVRFGVRNAKVNVFCSSKRDDDLDLVDIANELLEEKELHGLTETDDSFTQAHHVARSAGKFVTFEVHFG